MGLLVMASPGQLLHCLVFHWGQHYKVSMQLHVAGTVQVLIAEIFFAGVQMAAGICCLHYCEHTACVMVSTRASVLCDVCVVGTYVCLWLVVVCPRLAYAAMCSCSPRPSLGMSRITS